MTPVAEQSSLLKSFARSALPRPARNWLRNPIESAHDVYDEGLFQLGVVRQHEIRPGWRLTAQPGAFRRALWAQVHDAEPMAEFDRFVAACRPDMVFFDVGAHFGLFSLAALHYAPSSFCVAIEPSEFAARMLRLHATLNYPERRLLIRRTAAGPGRVLQELGAWGYRLEAPSGAPLTADAAVGPRVTRLVAVPSE